MPKSRPQPPRPDRRRLVAVDAMTGKQNVIFESKDEQIDDIEWLPDGSGLLALYYGRGANSYRRQISETSFRDHTARAITHDLNDYSELSISADGHMIATVLNQHRYDVFITPASLPESGQTQQVTFGGGAYRFAWTPDGEVILEEQQGALSLLHPDTGNKTLLTSQNRGCFSPMQPSIDYPHQ